MEEISPNTKVCVTAAEDAVCDLEIDTKRRIGQYKVPERLRSALHTSGTQVKMLDQLESVFPELNMEFYIENYAKHFDILIHLEEIACDLKYRKYNCEGVHFTRDGDFLSLTIENLSERSTCPIVGDKVRVTISGTAAENQWFEGKIIKIQFDRFLFKFDSYFQSSYCGEECLLKFQFSRFGFRKQHYAINSVAAQWGNRFLFPTEISLRERPQLNAELDDAENLHVGGKQCEWINGNLNSIQKRAIRSVLRGEVQSMAYVLFGPPGTGKTSTLIETILQLLKHIPSARLLVATPSNSSADLIALRVIDSKQLHRDSFVRIVAQNQIQKELIPQKLMPYCVTVDTNVGNTNGGTMVVTDLGMKLDCRMEFLAEKRVIIGTCASIGNLIQMDFPTDHFTHVVFDEAGQCTEPDIMMPICLVSPMRGQVIIAGDPKQLPALVTSRYAVIRGYATSYLERILGHVPYVKNKVKFCHTSGFDPRLVTKLLYNYRALPSVLKAYNELFYESELLPMVGEISSREAILLRELQKVLPTSQIRQKSHGVFFCGMHSENKQARDSPSWYNPIEAQNVLRMTHELYRVGIKSESIGIIAPYAKQEKYLRTRFKDSKTVMPKIGSVEQFQGQERDIIIVSTVRTCPRDISSDLHRSMGFIKCAKRLNVAISRARVLLLVYGDPKLLCNDKTWRAFLKYCAESGAYVGCDLPRLLHLRI